MRGLGTILAAMLCVLSVSATCVAPAAADGCGAGIAADCNSATLDSPPPAEAVNRPLEGQVPLVETTGSFKYAVPSVGAGALPGAAPATHPIRYPLTDGGISLAAIPTNCPDVLYDAPISIDARTSSSQRKVHWITPQNYFPVYTAADHQERDGAANSPTTTYVDGDLGVAYVPDVPGDGKPDGTGLQDMYNSILLAGQYNVWVAYVGHCSYQPGFVNTVDRVLQDGTVETLTRVYSLVRVVSSWEYAGQQTQVMRACVNDGGSAQQCFSDPRVAYGANAVLDPGPPPVQAVADSRALKEARKRALTGGGSLTTVPDPLWQLVEVPTRFKLTGEPASEPLKYFQASASSMDPRASGRLLHYEYTFKVGLESVTWTLTNTDTGETQVFPDVAVPARDPSSGSIGADTPWLTYTFHTAGHYHLSAVEHYAVSYNIGYYRCYPGCFVNPTNGFTRYPGGNFDLDATFNGQTFLPIQAGQVEGVPVS